MSKLLSKEEAMQKFGISDLRTFNTGDFIQIMSSFDKMDPEVLKELIGQIPNFLNFAKESMVIIKDSYEQLAKSDNESLDKVFVSYDLLIDSLNENLQDAELTIDQKLEISQMIRDIIHDKEDLHFKQQEKRHELYKQIATGVLSATIAIVGILTGVSMNKSSANNPKHIDNHS